MTISTTTGTLRDITADSNSPWHAWQISVILKKLATDKDKGLNEEDARKRQVRFGPNEITLKWALEWNQSKRSVYLKSYYLAQDSGNYEAGHQKLHNGQNS